MTGIGTALMRSPLPPTWTIKRSIKPRGQATGLHPKMRTTVAAQSSAAGAWAASNSTGVRSSRLACNRLVWYTSAMKRSRLARASSNVRSSFRSTSSRLSVLKQRSALALSEGLPTADLLMRAPTPPPPAAPRRGHRHIARPGRSGESAPARGDGR